jgi:hypothetical protein
VRRMPRGLHGIDVLAQLVAAPASETPWRASGTGLGSKADT